MQEFWSMFLITTINYPNYKKLADRTIKNKQEYCKRYDYHLDHHICKPSKDLCLGYEKINHLMELTKNRDYEWIWFLGCDTFITNMTIKIEDQIQKAASHVFLLMSVDSSGVNADSFLLKNSEDGRTWLKKIWDKRFEWNSQYPFEQGAMWQYNQEFSDHIRIFPQRFMNAYDLDGDPDKTRRKDVLGTLAQWQSGDWIVHWATMTLRNRLKACDKFEERIIR